MKLEEEWKWVENSGRSDVGKQMPQNWEGDASEHHSQSTPSSPYYAKHQTALSNYLGQDVIRAIKINADVMEGMFRWQGIIKSMPKHGHWTNPQIDAFCEDNPKVALVSVFAQQNDFFWDNKTIH